MRILYSGSRPAGEPASTFNSSLQAAWKKNREQRHSVCINATAPWRCCSLPPRAWLRPLQHDVHHPHWHRLCSLTRPGLHSMPRTLQLLATQLAPLAQRTAAQMQAPSGTRRFPQAGLRARPTPNISKHTRNTLHKLHSSRGKAPPAVATVLPQPQQAIQGGAAGTCLDPRDKRRAWASQPAA